MVGRESEDVLMTDGGRRREERLSGDEELGRAGVAELDEADYRRLVRRSWLGIICVVPAWIVWVSAAFLTVLCSISRLTRRSSFVVCRSTGSRASLDARLHLPPHHPRQLLHDHRPYPFLHPLLSHHPRLLPPLPILLLRLFSSLLLRYHLPLQPPTTSQLPSLHSNRLRTQLLRRSRSSISRSRTPSYREEERRERIASVDARRVELARSRRRIPRKVALSQRGGIHGRRLDQQSASQRRVLSVLSSSLHARTQPSSSPTPLLSDLLHQHAHSSSSGGFPGVLFCFVGQLSSLGFSPFRSSGGSSRDIRELQNPSSERGVVDPSSDRPNCSTRNPSQHGDGEAR